MIALDAPVPLAFRVSGAGRFVLCLRAEYEEVLRELLSPLDTLWDRLDRATPIARGRGSVVTWQAPGREERVVLRRYRHGGLLRGVLGERFWGTERPLREMAVAEHARESGVSTPLPLGAVIERRFWPTCRAVYLSAETASSEDMVHFCVRMSQEPPETAAREKNRVLACAARQVRAMHDAGIEHGDLHLKNMLLHHDAEGEPEVSIIEFDKSRERDPSGLDFRLANLMRLARSARKVRVAQAALGPRARLRFLHEYLRGLPAESELFRLWVPKLAKSGERREGWWAVTGADRDLTGDILGPPR